MKLSTLTPIAAVLAVSLAGVTHADTNPFAAKTVTTMTLAGNHEGSCGGMKKEDMKEGSCGGMKTAVEGKCGASKGMAEGKCGAAKMKAHKEGKCGEGKCGAKKKAAEAKASTVTPAKN